MRLHLRPNRHKWSRNNTDTVLSCRLPVAEIAIRPVFSARQAHVTPRACSVGTAPPGLERKRDGGRLRGDAYLFF
eukprot:scaffold991_cov278-Amphora_coffeaeformis.AAC.2